MSPGILSFFRKSKHEPIEHITLTGLIEYGARPADFSDATIRTLRLNAPRVRQGTMTEAQLADAMCWSVARLRSVCKSVSPPIDLAAEKEPEPRGA